MTDQIRDLLRYDPLDAAERLTGNSYKDDEGTSALGFLMHLDHSERKEAALKAAGDTHFSMPYAEACDVYERLGFEKVGTFPFEAEDGTPEEFSVWWHSDGLLLTAETYRTTGLNISKVRYNVRLNVPRSEAWDRLSSCSTTESGVTVGDHDAREGLAAKLQGLREVGEFLPVWEEQPFMWLLNYMDTKTDGYDHKAITESRIAALPQHVQTAIRGGNA